MQKKLAFEYEEYASKAEINTNDNLLLEAAYGAIKTAFAPYSKFRVGAAARLSDGSIVIGSNQESASYPVGICAERALLNSIGSQYPSLTISAIAVSYEPNGVSSTVPLSPCGMCRQSLLDFETRYQLPIRIILAGQTGSVMILPSAASLLPFGFVGSALGKKTD